MLSEIKENIQGTNSNRKETGTQINDLDQKEERFNQKRMKKQEFKKMTQMTEQIEAPEKNTTKQ